MVIIIIYIIYIRIKGLKLLGRSVCYFKLDNQGRYPQVVTFKLKPGLSEGRKYQKGETLHLKTLRQK